MWMLSFSVVLCVVSILLVKYNGQHPKLVDRPLRSSYDYIIVGGGTAGSVLGRRLSENPNNTVLVLEAGQYADDDPRISTPFLFQSLQGSQHDWGFVTQNQKRSLFAMEGQKLYWPRGRVLGGSSNLNAMAYSRGCRKTFDMWESKGCMGWGYEQVLPYFKKSEDIKIDALKDTVFHSTGGPLPISLVENTPLAESFMKAGGELGYDTVDLNGEKQIGFSKMQANIYNGVRYSVSRAFLVPVLGRDNLHVKTDSVVTKVLFQDKRAVGVNVINSGRKTYIKASKEIILSAGAVNSPKLLMLSGIGPSKHLKDIGIDVVRDLPVGNNLQDHMVYIYRQFTNTSFSVSEEDVRTYLEELKYKLFGRGYMSFAGPEGSAYFHSKGNMEGQPADLMISLYSVSPSSTEWNQPKTFMKPSMANEFFGNIPKGKGAFSLSLFLMNANSRGTVRLASKDPFDYPLIDPNYLAYDEDVKRFIAGIRFCQRLSSTSIMQSIGASRSDALYRNVCTEHVLDSDQYWECMIRTFAFSINHDTSTCKMGHKDDVTTVVDPELRVLGVSGLRVVDGSVIPHLYSGSPHALVIMIAEKAADIIQGIHTANKI